MPVWLTERFGITGVDARDRNFDALSKARGNGQMHVFQWLTTRFAIGAEEVRTNAKHVLSDCFREKQKTTVKLLADTFRLTPDHIGEPGNAKRAKFVKWTAHVGSRE